MTPRTRVPALLALASCALLVALGVGPTASARPAATPVAGGDVVIARTADSQSMDATSIFDNESIWVFEQLMEPLYQVTPDGKDVKPWLATSYDLSPDKLTYTFHLRHGVFFHTGKEMTSKDVKFSIDAAKQPKAGWSFIDVAIKSVTAKDKYTAVIKTKYKWAPLIADLALFNNDIVPANYDGKSKADFYKAPVGTGPFKWASPT
jgi:peptide/nickel transport system substrate-binding protein